MLWHWIRGAVSKEGITADLEAMKSGGIGGAYLLAIRDAGDPPVHAPPVRTLTPEWWEMLRHACAEADRLGLKLGLHACDGFATAGGPWITPELAMQKVVWSETVVAGGRVDAILAQPATKEGYYRDIAVLALPLPDGWEVNTRTRVPTVTTSLPGTDARFLVAPDGEKQLRTAEPCWIQYSFEAPFTLRSLVIRNWLLNYGGLYHATRLKIEVSDDGVNFRPHFRLTPPRHGWQDWDEDYTFGVPEVTARHFRFVHDPTGAEPGGEDLNGAKWRPRLVLRGLELSSGARIDNYEGKSGAVWRRPSGAAGAVPAGALVPPDRVLDLTARMTPEGRLAWEAPAGRWLVLRFGHTPTGHRNETAGGGKGLEADKFNPAAVRLQFDRWFGESIRQVGEERARRVLRHLLQDSWEAGSQNWSPVFRDEFRRRRGYDPVQLLPAMAGVPLGTAGAEESETFLRDVRQTIADLTDEHFFGTMAQLAHAAGVEYAAEATAPTMMGDGMRHFGRVDLPMGEFWLRSPTHDKPNDIADAVSGAHVYGKNIVQAEAFTQLGIRWDEHPGMLKPLADEHFALGINRLVFHVFAHNPWLDRKPGMTLDRVGLYFQRDQTWWPEVQGWTDYVARCSALLQAGRPVVDVAYFTGEELPSRALLPDRRARPLPDGFKADSINADALRRAGARGGRLELPGGASYAALVFPGADQTDRAETTKRERLATRGGGLFMLSDNVSLAEHLQHVGVEPDLLWSDRQGRPADALAWTHRRTGEADIYFVTNRSTERLEGTLSLRATGRAEIWEPVTGTIQRNPSQQSAGTGGGRLLVGLALAPHGSAFVVVRPGPAAADPESRIGRSICTELGGGWHVSFDPALGGPKEPQRWDALVDWTTRPEFGIRHYSGTATYRTTFEVPAVNEKMEAWIELGTVHNLARVFVNGKDCGVLWTPPFATEITGALKEGENVLEIRVTNTWANRLLGDATLPEDERVTWTTAPASTRPEKLLPAGLLGPVSITVRSWR